MWLFQIGLAAMIAAGQTQGPGADLSPAQRAEAYRRTVEGGLKAERSSFAERADLVRFVDRALLDVVAPTKPEFELFRLLALARAAESVERYMPEDPAQREWLAAHRNELVYSESGGVWLVGSDLFWQLEVRYRGSPVGERIAWEAALNGLPGECEGFVNCYFAVMLLLDAKYLEFYPRGPHLDAALDRIDYLFKEVLNDKDGAIYAVDPADRAALQEQVRELGAILQRLANPRKNEMLERLNQIAIKFSKS